MMPGNRQHENFPKSMTSSCFPIFSVSTRSIKYVTFWVRLGRCLEFRCFLAFDLPAEEAQIVDDLWCSVKRAFLW